MTVLYCQPLCVRKNKGEGKLGYTYKLELILLLILVESIDVTVNYGIKI